MILSTKSKGGHINFSVI